VSRTSWIAAALGAVAISLPDSSLAVKRGSAWTEWWNARSAPTRWEASDSARIGPVSWKRAAAGIEWSEVVLAGNGEAWRTRVVVARVDPRQVRLRLDTAFAREGGAKWTIDRTRATDVFAINAGQFLQSMPWGQVLLGGSQWLGVGRGPLASTVAIDSTGIVRLVHARGVPERGTLWAFQSYPTLLRGGDVPPELQAADRGIDVEHRDARAAIGVMDDGRVIVALTRFDALGATLGFIPFGLTVPEMAAVMGVLGARDAVMLDGGISGQLFLREANGTAHAWHGSRNVPLALVGTPR
jgi:uncharacterized protein YigE (DUF2233 family)